jgi:hypothetical protein
MRNAIRGLAAGAALAAAVATTPTMAEEIAVDAALFPKEQIELPFQDTSRRSVRLTHREGRAAGTGPLAGATVAEYGFHDLAPGVGGEALGYLVFAVADGIAYVKWHVRGTFVKGEGGAPALVNSGFWEIVGGTGRFAALKGAGAIHIRLVGPKERRYVLTGRIAPRD